MKSIIAILIMAFSCQVLEAQNDIALEITQYEGGKWKDRIIENGLPFPKGSVMTVDDYQLLGNDVPVASDLHALAWWPDGSIRWGKITFQYQDNTDYTIKTGLKNTTSKGFFEAKKDGNTWTVSTGKLRFVMKENGFNLLDAVWISSSENDRYDRQIIYSGSNKIIGNGTITLIEDGPYSKRFLFEESYNSNEIGVMIWLTCYRNSTKIRLEYTDRNAKSTQSNFINGALGIKLGKNQQFQGKIYGKSVEQSFEIQSVKNSTDLRGAVKLMGPDGGVAVLVNRFTEMYPRRIQMDKQGNLNVILMNGKIEGMSVYGADIQLEFLFDDWSDEMFRNWADYYEFPAMALPAYPDIQKMGVMDGFFLGNVRNSIPNVPGWADGYSFEPVSPGYENYGELRLNPSGNGHGLHIHFSSAFDRFLVNRNKDRFLQAEELAIGLIESRKIYMDGVNIDISGEGFEQVDALFGTTDWTNTPEGRMWDADHRGFFPITEHYYITGKMRVKNAFENITKSSKYLYQVPSYEVSRTDERGGGYYLSQFARNYSITRNADDLKFVDAFLQYLKEGAITIPGEMNNHDPYQNVGFPVHSLPFENDCGWKGLSIKTIFVSNWMQSMYDVYQLTGNEIAKDHIYAAGQWMMEAITNAVQKGLPPAYCYRPDQTPNAPGPWWEPQHITGLAIYYHLFGDERVLDIYKNLSEIWWGDDEARENGAGFASVVASVFDLKKKEHIPPIKVTDLGWERGPGERIKLIWRNANDAVRIQIKYAYTDEIIKDLYDYNNDDFDGLSWWKLGNIDGEPLPVNGIQSWQTDLDAGSGNFKFVIKSWDAEGNVSEMSQVGLEDGISASYRINHNTIEVYPNPFIDRLNVKIDNPRNAAIRISNMGTGQIIFHTNVPQRAKIVFPIHGSPAWPSGVYLLEIKDKNGIYTQKLIKQE